MDNTEWPKGFGWLFVVMMLVSFAVIFWPRCSGAEPLRMIVAYPPGGGTDIVARKIADSLPWTTVIDNRPGASGLIGTEIADKAQDNRTLLMGHITPNGINPGAFMEPRLCPQFSLRPVAMVAMAPSALITLPQIFSVNSLLAELRAPKISYASDGYGSLAHLQAEALLTMNGSRALHVPYKGGAPALQGFAAGDITFMFSPLPVALGWITDRKLTAHAVTSSKRSPVIPAVPTMQEIGFAINAPLWWGIFAPRSFLNLSSARSAITAVTQSKEYQEWLLTQGMTNEAGIDFAKFVAAEQKRWHTYDCAG